MTCYISLVLFLCAEKERHANSSTEKKASNQLPGLSGKLSLHKYMYRRNSKNFMQVHLLYQTGIHVRDASCDWLKPLSINSVKCKLTPSWETCFSSRETRLSSHETLKRLSSRETRFLSRGKRLSIRESRLARRESRLR